MQELLDQIKALYSVAGFNPPVEDLVRFAISVKHMVETLTIENADGKQDAEQQLQLASLIESFECQLKIVIHLTDRSKLLKYQIL